MDNAQKGLMALGVAAMKADANAAAAAPGVGAPYGASPGDGVILNQRYPDPPARALPEPGVRQVYAPYVNTEGAEKRSFA